MNVVYLAKLTAKPKITIQEDELVEAQFFNINSLPEGTSPGTRRRVAEYLKNQIPLTTEW